MKAWIGKYWPYLLSLILFCLLSATVYRSCTQGGHTASDTAALNGIVRDLMQDTANLRHDRDSMQTQNALLQGEIDSLKADAASNEDQSNQIENNSERRQHEIRHTRVDSTNVSDVADALRKHRKRSNDNP